MQSNQVRTYSEEKEEIIKAVDMIADPVRGTMSPKGRNVLFKNNVGTVLSSNDGATIARAINPKSEVANMIVSVIKQSSFKTNTEAGDGTSTSILLSQVMIKEGLKQVDNGWNPMMLKGEMQRFGAELVKTVKEKAIKVSTDKDLENIAYISANNDREIAKNIVKVVKTAGLDGMVFLEPNNKPEVEIIEDTGFNIEQGILYGEMINNPQRNSATYTNIPVLITDKRLYYQEEAETILKTVLEAGLKSVVIVARDFIGQSVNYFLTNHKQGVINVLLIKDPRVTEKDATTLEDLAVYLGGKVISEKTGSLVNKLKISDFVMADKVFVDPVKSLISTKKKKNPELATRVSGIRELLKKDKDDEVLKKRLASLTNGMVTVKIGASSQIEMTERVFRYEDAVNATRAAMRDGYLVGGGISVFRAFESMDKSKFPAELVPMFKRFCEANIRQIAENCGKHPDTIVEEIASKKGNFGYNAMTGEIEDLLKSGVVDPYKVTEMAINNSISVAGEIISSGFIIINEEDINE